MLTELLVFVLDHGFEFSRWPVAASCLLFLDAFEDAVKRSKELAESGCTLCIKLLCILNRLFFVSTIPIFLKIAVAI